jgi:hypothetical protein
MPYMAKRCRTTSLTDHFFAGGDAEGFVLLAQLLGWLEAALLIDILHPL